ncbi:MAG: phosphate ABC transporter permease PstA [Planctomycetia bacterium]|nr:phosphate ABC transporter permease PstA [Planctomycetia bacterium]
MKRRTLLFRNLTDRTMGAVAIACLLGVLAAMLWILESVGTHGAAVISWEFLTQPSRPHGVPGGGIANALLGTFLMTLCAAAMAVPAAMAGGIWLSEFAAESKTGGVLRAAANVMMGIPSIVTGLFVYAAWVVPTGHFSGFAGSLALAIIMFPVVMRTTEDMLRMVPNTQREAALALGMTRARATLTVVCRCARGGLATGVLMALARVSGETAPLLFTALWSNAWCGGFFHSPTANIPVLMTEYTTNSPYEALHAAGWGAALVMMACLLVLNITTRIYANR